jgi:2-polyprenyl-3-methyl-5-hydroxy-6-metoxy-1,4-benzoquinol methylase
LPAGGRLLADVDELQEGEVFDLVCAFDVLEHLPDNRDALERWVRHVRAGAMCWFPCRLNPLLGTP